MKKLGLLLLALILCLIITSCSSTASLIERFSLDVPTTQESTTKILTGSVSYGAGIYFPSSNDLLDISLLKTDAITGTLQEISHQRIRNIQRFPLQFTLRYDESDLKYGDSCSLLVTLTVDGSVSAQGVARLEFKEGSFSESSVLLTSVLTEPKTSDSTL
jgi:uncharacterized lipoprotein YbaY